MPNWKPERLPISVIRKDDRFQVRAAGLDRPNLLAIGRALDAGDAVEPLKVARIGKAYYLVDGWHRMEALEKAGETHADVQAARMSARDAQLFSLTVNASHGKSLTRADKRKALETFVALGEHLDADGIPKASRVIRDELRGIYSHQTILARLKAMGHEIPKDVEYPDGYKPFGGGAVDGDDDDFWEHEGDELCTSGVADDPMEAERSANAMGHIGGLRSLLPTLTNIHQGEALKALRGLVDSLVSGEWPEEVETIPLDI